MDFIRTLDSSKLLLAGTGISFLLSTSPALAYNLPVFLFGTFVQEQSEAVLSLQTFTGLLPVTALFDLVSFFKSNHNFWTGILTILLLVLKIPTFFAFSALLHQRGGELGLGIGGTNIQGATVWAMPGGFTSSGGDGYQPVDDDAFVRAPRPGMPSSPMPPPPQVRHSQSPPGAYQSV